MIVTGPFYLHTKLPVYCNEIKRISETECTEKVPILLFKINLDKLKCIRNVTCLVAEHFFSSEYVKCAKDTV